MSIKNEDNLNKLLSAFMDSDSAEMAAEDFRQVDLIFEKYESAEPDSRLLKNIKADIRRELNHSKASMFKTAMLRFAAVAAVFLIAASVWFVMNQNTPQQNQVQAVAKVTNTASTATSIWDSEDVTSDDAQYETFKQEIEQIESEIVAIKCETESTIYGESELTEIENDLIEIQSDFWKG